MYQTWLLVSPVPCGVLLALYQYATNQDADSDLVPLYCIINSIWATVFVEKLKRKEAEILYKWDLLHDMDTIKRPRKEFYGDDTIDFLSMNRIIFFPPRIRTRITIMAQPAFLFLFFMCGGLFFFLDSAQHEHYLTVKTSFEDAEGKPVMYQPNSALKGVLVTGTLMTSAP
jgi:hypothetical protein